MKLPRTRRKCLNCKEPFLSDYRNAYHHYNCSKPDCRKARKRQAQRAWLAKQVSSLLTLFRRLDLLRPMPRKRRIQHPSIMYHVMNRGDQREDVFQDDKDRRVFLSTLGEACQKTEWQVHAYCLVSNHFHLVLETPQPNLVLGVKWFPGVSTSATTSVKSRVTRSSSFCPHHFAAAPPSYNRDL